MKLPRPAFRSLTLLLLLLGVFAPVALPFVAAQEPAQTAAPEHRPGGEVNIRLPDLNQGDFLGFTGHEILLSGLVVCVLGLLFGLWSYTRVKNLPVHRSMAEISDLIYETCKAYMIQQGKLLLVLLGFIGTVIVVYFLLTGLELSKIAIILLFSVIGMAGSYGVAWFGIRINTFANSRTAFASLRGRAWPVSDIPLRAGMSVGMMLISVELLFMLGILLFIPADVARFNFESPLTQLVWFTSILSVVLTYILSYLIVPDLGGNGDLWWQLSTVITCGTLAGAIIPEMVKVFTSTESRHVREVVAASREGGASLNILSGLVAGNFSAYWLGIAIMLLMAAAYGVSTLGLGELMKAPAIFAFGLVAFGFLGMGPVTIAVDSYGPVTDNAQSVYELSLIEQVPNIDQEIKRDFAFAPNFELAKELLEENDGAGNTFKATAKPVLIGTAVVGATTMIFSIIMALTHGLTGQMENLSILHPPFLLGLITGGAVIYWFTGASIQAVTTGAYRAVEFIKANIRLEGTTRASVEDSRKVVEICTQYAQKGMFNIFLGVFFSTLAFAFIEPFFFIGYLISIAMFGLFQAIFMANAGGAWDNAKKIVETELKMKGTELHAASVVGDTVGDPFKDTSSVAMNPVIKFTTLFGLLAVELGVYLAAGGSSSLARVLAVVFFLVAVYFVYRSFYGMRIESAPEARAANRHLSKAS